MTSSKGETMQVNDIVIFSPRQGETAEGIVTRVWDKPAADPYVTVRTTEDEGRTFVRSVSTVLSAGQGAGKSRVPAEGDGIGTNSRPAASPEQVPVLTPEMTETYAAEFDRVWTRCDICGRDKSCRSSDAGLGTIIYVCSLCGA